MSANVLHAAWPLLVLLLYALVTCVLSVLATHRSYAVGVHDVVRESKLKRAQYLRTLADRDEEAGVV